MIAVTLFHVPGYRTVNLIEFIWTLTGFVTIIFCVYRLRAAELRAHELKMSGRNGSMQLLARGYIRREVIRILQGLCIFGVGFYADVQPSPTGQDYITWGGLVVTLALLLIGALVVGQSVGDWIQARHVVQVILQEENERKRSKST